MEDVFRNFGSWALFLVVAVLMFFMHRGLMHGGGGGGCHSASPSGKKKVEEESTAEVAGASVRQRESSDAGERNVPEEPGGRPV
ncbi:MAG: hypothetical protein HY677_03480 [Chloroflexi bacterium]|nr:hypothetical protein [Chloroflexota bacterium]